MTEKMLLPNGLMSDYDLKRWKAKDEFKSIIWGMDDAALGCAIGFALALGKLEEFEKKIAQASFPTFFGHPCRTVLTMDGLASFYFMIYLEKDTEPNEDPKAYRGAFKPKVNARWQMNGGLIFHPGWRKCSLRPGFNEPCECGAPIGTEPEKHKDVRDNATGSWSIHT